MKIENKNYENYLCIDNDGDGFYEKLLGYCYKIGISRENEVKFVNYFINALAYNRKEPAGFIVDFCSSSISILFHDDRYYNDFADKRSCISLMIKPVIVSGDSMLSLSLFGIVDQYMKYPKLLGIPMGRIDLKDFFNDSDICVPYSIKNSLNSIISSFDNSHFNEFSKPVFSTKGVYFLDELGNSARIDVNIDYIGNFYSFTSNNSESKFCFSDDYFQAKLIKSLENDVINEYMPIKSRYLEISKNIKDYFHGITI